MLRELRICPGVGSQKCGAFLSTLDRDPHPTCTRCRGKVCTKDMTCDICADWSAGAVGTVCEEALLQRTKEAFSPFRLCSTCAVGFSPRGNSFGSFAAWDFFLFSFPPFRWAGEEGGVSRCTWCCVPAGLGWECLWTVVCCARAPSRFYGSFGSW